MEAVCLNPTIQDEEKESINKQKSFSVVLVTKLNVNDD